MAAYQVYQGRIEPMLWGETTYTILRLPDTIVAALGNPKRVEGEIGDAPINLAVTRAPVIDSAFVYTGKRFLRDTGLEPGQDIEVRLRAADPNAVEVPDDLRLALRGAKATDLWEGLSPGKRRSLLAPLNAARTQTTRDRKIRTLLSDLRDLP